MSCIIMSKRKGENMREEIKEFAEEMEKVMQKHDRYKKDSWKTCNLEYLEKKLVEEYKEWKDGNVLCPLKNEVVDIANVCMMLFHRYIKCDD